MSCYLISVCVRLRQDANPEQVARLVVGTQGRIQRMPQPTRFWARTPLTLKQVQAIEGVQACHLAPAMP